ncbi:MAG: hypothetical protein ACKVOW_02160 [Chitinophagaceae bacterium]
MNSFIKIAAYFLRKYTPIYVSRLTNKPTAMKKKLILACFFIILAQNIFAQWNGIPSSVNNPISNSPETERTIYSVTDGSGGAILAWLAYDITFNKQLIYMQRKTATGAISWTTAATPLLIFTTLSNDIAEINDLVPDGAGGAYITWVEETTDTSSNIYLQRISNTGAKLFALPGIAINTDNGHYFSEVKICTDATGLIVCWSDQMLLPNANTPTYAQVFAQRYNTTGTAQWAGGGILVSTAAGIRAISSIVSDGSNGAFISFSDARNSGIDVNGEYDNIDIYAQHLSSTGTRLWGAADAAVTTELFNQTTLGTNETRTAMISDSAGGIILVYYDYRSNNNGPANFYAQRLNGSGTLLWPAGGLAVSNSSAINKNKFNLLYDGANGIIASWDENDFVNNIGGMYAQRISSTGTLPWGATAIVANGALASGYGSSTIAADGTGNYVLNWVTFDNGVGSNVIRGQKLNANGTAQWTSGGVSICTNPLSFPQNPVIIRSTTGTMLVAWEDDRNIATSNTDIYSARITPAGFLFNTTSINYVTTANGNWNSPSTWVGNTVPPPGAIVIIRHNVIGNVNASCISLRVESPAVLTVNTGIIITVLQ